MIYRGRNEKLLQELKDHEQALEEAYRSVLGEHYTKVKIAEQSLLIPEAFASSVREFPKPEKAYEHYSAETEDDSMFMCPMSGNLASIEVERDGKIMCKSGIAVSTSCGIVLNDKGVEIYAGMHKGSLPPHLASFSHEYGHFIPYAVQPRPVVCAAAILSTQLDKAGFRIDPVDAEDAEEKINQLMDMEDKHLFHIFYLSLEINSLSEAMANNLVVRVFRRLGYNTEALEETCIESKSSGKLYESLRQIKDREVGDYIASWDSVMKSGELASNFLASLGKVRFKKMDIVRFNRENADISSLQNENRPED